ncbi:hypothetical protein BU14_0745s0003 [Porphyra umbilicalis]|uniref:Uncharacterized protein n=1 Tax=Porphyra umbilicalis TaxID=2786 RepID=A0A1X6NPH3_PORUM|nr:hypothetical protein BU14_0745s0003 [Porphyra umbilicalis]|eukprot:OSX70475.1 hypothetical protein BU14_0745s0003 [Porphyra umbilicalis]
MRKVGPCDGQGARARSDLANGRRLGPQRDPPLPRQRALRGQRAGRGHASVHEIPLARSCCAAQVPCEACPRALRVVKWCAVGRCGRESDPVSPAGTCTWRGCPHPLPLPCDSRLRLSHRIRFPRTAPSRPPQTCPFFFLFVAVHPSRGPVEPCRFYPQRAAAACMESDAAMVWHPPRSSGSAHRELVRCLNTPGLPEDAQRLQRLLADRPLLTRELVGLSMQPPLHVAARVGKPALVRVLLAAGADVDARGSCDMTPLCVAALTSNAATVRVLLDAGASVRSRTSSDEDMTPLLLAAEGGHPEVLAELLTHCTPADVAAVNAQRSTALMLAAANCQSAEIVRQLLAAGASVHPRLPDGRTAFMVAAEHCAPAAAASSAGGPPPGLPTAMKLLLAPQGAKPPPRSRCCGATPPPRGRRPIRPSPGPPRTGSGRWSRRSSTRAPPSPRGRPTAQQHYSLPRRTATSPS